MEGVPARRRGLQPRRRPLGRNLGFKLGLELHEDGLRGLQVPGQCMNLEEQLFGKDFKTIELIFTCTGTDMHQNRSRPVPRYLHL